MRTSITVATLSFAAGLLTAVAPAAYAAQSPRGVTVTVHLKGTPEFIERGVKPRLQLAFRDVQRGYKAYVVTYYTANNAQTSPLKAVSRKRVPLKTATLVLPATQIGDTQYEVEVDGPRHAIFVSNDVSLSTYGPITFATQGRLSSKTVMTPTGDFAYVSSVSTRGTTNGASLLRLPPTDCRSITLQLYQVNDPGSTFSQQITIDRYPMEANSGAGTRVTYAVPTGPSTVTLNLPNGDDGIGVRSLQDPTSDTLYVNGTLDCEDTTGRRQ